MKKQTFLDFGSGIRPYPDATHLMDYYNFPKETKLPYIKWDFDKFPYPFPDNSFDVVYSRCTLEHMNYPIKVMNELYRIAKKKVIVIVPHFSHQAAFNHIEHKNFFGAGSWVTFYDIDDNEGGIKWKGTPKVSFIYAYGRRLFKWMNWFYEPLINLNPIRTERYFLPLVYGGIEFVKFEFDKEQ